MEFIYFPTAWPRRAAVRALSLSAEVAAVTTRPVRGSCQSLKNPTEEKTLAQDFSYYLFIFWGEILPSAFCLFKGLLYVLSLAQLNRF